MKHRSWSPLLLLLLGACPEPATGTTTDAGATTDAGSTTTAPGPSTAGTTGSDPTTGGATDTGASTMQATTEPAACHPKVGWRAVLVENYHGVTGTAEVRDDCSIVVTDFGYDGTGIDVRFYGGKNGDYSGGFPLSDNLLKPGGYAGETLVLDLPDGRTLDDLDGLSVWCVDVSIDFGSGLFAPP